MASSYSNIEALKRHAKQIARERNCKHHIALDLAACEGGYQNFAHAKRHIEVAAQRSHAITLVQRWINHEVTPPQPRHGTVTLDIHLRLPLADLVKQRHLTGYLGGCRLGDDGTLHVHAGGYLNDDPTYALRRLNRVARALRFMEITGLRPSDSHRCYPRSKWHLRPPIADHDHAWYHPETKQFVLSTEPYGSDPDSRRRKMLDWCYEHDFIYESIARPSVYGLGTELYLMTKAGTSLDLAGMATRLQAAPHEFLDQE